MNQKQTYQWNEYAIGVCYYPEHWEKNLWVDDLRRMKDAGITVIRIGEFAWSLVEPEEGVYSYAFFDEFLDLCEREGMHVIFGTPTATPPAWLSYKYPEILNRNQDGVPYRHGGRRHYNYNSPKYQELCEDIVTRIAQHYGPHPAIVGWQIDNEINCETDEFYSEADSCAFRRFLREKYTTLDNLNKSWGTVFWNETYTDWEQIFVPGPILNKGYNPHLHLDYFRFISDSAIRFCGMQADILRKYKKEGDFITTNGIFGNLDNHRMETECLDVLTYDSYPSFAYGLDRDPLRATDLNDRRWTKKLGEVRSICPHFGIMEQQSGANGWTTRMEGPAPRPGQMTLWAMQSIAQGADYLSFFRWRTCCFGTEMYWHGILDYDNRDNRKLAEVKEIGRKVRAIREICGAGFKAAFGVVKDYDNQWDVRVDSWHARVEKFSDEEIFRAAEKTHTPYDYVYLTEETDPEELAAYPVLIYAHPVIMTEKKAAVLKAYVQQGGTLIIGCRSGYKDATGKCVMMPQPGLLQELTGSDVRDFTFVSKAEEPVYAQWNDGQREGGQRDDGQQDDGQWDGGQQDGRRLDMPVFNDILEPAQGSDDTRVLAVYGNSYYAGKAALTQKQTGKGRTLHLGAAFCEQTVKELLAYTGVLRPFEDRLAAPEEVQVILREKGGEQYFFVLNYMPEERTVEVKCPMWSLFEETAVQGTVTLPPYGVQVYKVER